MPVLICQLALTLFVCSDQRTAEAGLSSARLQRLAGLLMRCLVHCRADRRLAGSLMGCLVPTDVLQLFSYNSMI